MTVTSLVGLPLAVPAAHERASKLFAGYTRFAAFFEPKSNGGGISAAGTVDDRNPVAVDFDAAGAGVTSGFTVAIAFEFGPAPPQATRGAIDKVQTKIVLRIGRQIRLCTITMSPRIIQVDAERPEKEPIAEAVEVLRDGGLVAFPTETVYGLGARAFDGVSVARIFSAKGRPATHPIIAHVLDEEGARLLAADWSALSSDLARAFWPGPLTIIAPKRTGVPVELTGGGDSVGIRAPAHPVARALIAALGEPIAAPSANRFQQISPTLAAHVVKSLGDAVDLVLDGGACVHGIESTVISISSAGEIHLLRPGSITIAQLRTHAPVIYESRIVADNARRDSPGLDAKHYAPRARLVLAARDRLSAMAAAMQGNVGLILSDKLAGSRAFAVHVLSDDPEHFASGLFAALHDLDDRNCDVILVEEPPSDDAWIAVRDRLGRASEK